MRATTLLLVALALPIPANAAETTPSAVAFKQLSSLAGEWEGVQDGVPLRVTCTLTANGSALMETEQPGNESPMITMFTRDGDQLIATHYCSAGNQPQMITTKIGDLEKEGSTFALVRVTGMTTPDDWHNMGLMVTQPDKVQFYQGETERYTRKQ